MPSVKFSPFGNQQFVKEDGAPAAGWKYKTYVAGSSTPLAAYTDSSGSAPHPAAIILDALGLPETGQIWLAVGSAYKIVVTDETDVVKGTIDNISGVNDASISTSQWQASGVTPTYIGPSSFSVPGDQTTEFHAGRRAQPTTTAGTVYGTIASSVYGVLTTVTMTMDSGDVLDSGLSAVNLGLLRADEPALPNSAAARSALGATAVGSAIFSTAAGGIVDRSYAEYTANANLTAIIPADDTVPTNTEGTQILSLTHTPKSTTNRLRVRVKCSGTTSAIDGWSVAVFEGATCKAADRAVSSVAEHADNVIVEKEWVPGVTSALTISVRVGPATATTLRLNGVTAARMFGGASACTLIVEEIAV